MVNARQRFLWLGYASPVTSPVTILSTDQVITPAGRLHQKEVLFSSLPMVTYLPISAFFLPPPPPPPHFPFPLFLLVLSSPVRTTLLHGNAERLATHQTFIFWSSKHDSLPFHTHLILCSTKE